MPGAVGPRRSRPLYTVGHSDRTLDELVELLRGVSVSLLVDIRTVPRSRHNPQFNRETLPGELARRGLRYLHLPELGGLRRPLRDSPNTGWRNASFRGFADYMQTEEFAQALDRLRTAAARRRTAIMCAEAVPWRCHRSLVADALLLRGTPVIDLIGPRSARPHAMTPWARVRAGRLLYPPLPPAAASASGRHRKEGAGAATPRRPSTARSRSSSGTPGKRRARGR